jgi:CRISPR-associated protein Cmr3
MSVLWRFTPLDTLFFRDGRPFNAGETVWLESLFPPSGRTLQGVIRSAIIEYSGNGLEDLS